MLMFLLGIFALAAVVFLLLAVVSMAMTSVYAFLGIVGVLAVAWWIAGKDWGIGRIMSETMPAPPEPAPKRGKRTIRPSAEAGERSSLDNLWTDEDDLA